MSNNNSESEILNAINKINDPDLEKTFGDLQSVKFINLNDDTLQLTLELIQPINWVENKIKQEIANTVHSINPKLNIELNITESTSNCYNRDILKGVKNIIAVASGKGGVGKSAIAANLAAGLSLAGAKVGILDGDVYGPSVPTMFGLAGQPFDAVEGPDKKILAYPNEKYGIKVASMGFIMNRDEAAIVRGPMLAGYFSMLFEQIAWGPLDFLVFDLPPGTGDIQLTLTQRIPLSGAVIVTTPQEIAVVDVRRSIAMFKRVNVDIFGIVENMSYFSPEDMPDKKYFIFGEGGGQRIAEENNINLLGKVPLDIKMRNDNDSGKPIILSGRDDLQVKILKDITEKVVSQLRKRNLTIIENPSPVISI